MPTISTQLMTVKSIQRTYDAVCLQPHLDVDLEKADPLAGQSEEHDRLTAAFATLARLDQLVRGIAENIFHAYGLADAGFTAGVIFAAVDPNDKPLPS